MNKKIFRILLVDDDPIIQIIQGQYLGCNHASDTH